jgi:urease accessory protein
LIVDGSFPGWHARLELAFGLSGKRTVLKRARSVGPLYVQRLFYPEGPSPGGVIPAEACLLHPPGGMAGGDVLEHDLELEDGAWVLVTTPGAGKVYKAGDDGSGQRQAVRAALRGGSVLEWLPQEAIAFDRARASFSLSFDLDNGSRLLAWDIFTLGRPEAGELFVSGSFRQSLEIRQGGDLVSLERFVLDPGGALGPAGPDPLKSPLGMDGSPCSGVFHALGRRGSPEDLQALREARDELRALYGGGSRTPPGEARAAVTLRGGLLTARAHGPGAEDVKGRLIPAWHCARRRLLKAAARIPRIWRT